MNRIAATFALLTLFWLSLTPALAQSFSRARTLTEEFDLTASFSGRSDLTSRGVDAGDFAVASFGGGVRTFRPITSGGRGLVFGLEWTEHQLAASAAAALPDQLREVRAVLGLNYPIGERWSARAYIWPGLYGDFENVSARDFNAPALLLASYKVSPELNWSFGLRVDAFSDNPVIPIVGVRWAFAPAWTFNVGLPRTGLFYDVNERLAIRFGVSLLGGSYHVSDAVAPGLQRTLLDYREFRVGLGAAYRLGENLNLDLEVGSSLDRRFDYHERGVKLEGENAGFVSLGLNGKF